MFSKLPDLNYMSNDPNASSHPIDMIKIFADERQQLSDMIERPDISPINDRDFKKLIMMISKEVEGGFDGKIRFPALEEEFC